MLFLSVSPLVGRGFRPQGKDVVPAMQSDGQEPFALRHLDVAVGAEEPASASQRYTVHHAGSEAIHQQHRATLANRAHP